MAGQPFKIGRPWMTAERAAVFRKLYSGGTPLADVIAALQLLPGPQLPTSRKRYYEVASLLGIPRHKRASEEMSLPSRDILRVWREEQMADRAEKAARDPRYRECRRKCLACGQMFDSRDAGNRWCGCFRDGVGMMG